MTQNNFKIAITGGIGSGKSTVADIIAEEGFSVISCDEVYAQLLHDKTFLSKLHKDFGEAFNAGGGLDKSKLSAIVFNDKLKLEKLNQISHSEIMKEVMRLSSGTGIFFCEIPLLFECNYESHFDRVIVVLREKALRIAAVKERSNLTGQEVILRINSQYDYDNNNFEKYYVIHNSSNLENLRVQTLDIIEKIKKDLL